MARNAVRARGYMAATATAVLRPLVLMGPAQVGVSSTIRIADTTAGSTLAVTAGTLPTGLTLNSAARTITGTPTAAGSTSVTITETKVGATGSPKATAVSIVVIAEANTDAATAYTFIASDVNRIVPRPKATAQTVTIPPNSSVAFPIDTVLTVMQTGAGALTVVAGGGVTLNYLASLSLASAGQHAVIQAVKTATDTWTVYGALEAA